MDQYVNYLSWIDEKQKEIEDLLVQWSNIHSGTDNLKGLSEILSALKTSFSETGGVIEELALAPKKTLTSKGDILEKPLGKALKITMRPDAETQILLGGHMDIAYAKENKLPPCQKKKGGIYVGRGTADMKGGLLVMLFALLSLEKSPFAERIGWQVFITPDEEIGSPGSRPQWIELAKGKKLALIFEPSFPDGKLVSGRKGSVNYSLAVQGKAAHAGREFHLGANAITSIARFALAAESLNEIGDELHVNIGYIKGGGPVNSVPHRAFLRLNIRSNVPKEMKTAQSKLKEIAEMENQRKDIKAILYQDSIRPPKLFDKRTRSVFELLKLSAKHLGIPLDWKASGGVCDGNILANQGIITIDTMGGVGGNLHTAEEYIKLSSIAQRAKLTARFLMQIAAGEVTIP